ncbi:cAMP-dependent protein kinase regulatory subunit, partial [Hondaea fermentalgiana]
PEVDEVYKRKCADTIQALAKHTKHGFTPVEPAQIAKELGAIAKPKNSGQNAALGATEDAILEQKRFLREERIRECTISHEIATRLRKGLVKEPWLRTELDVGLLEAWLRAFALFQDLSTNARMHVARALQVVVVDQGEDIYRIRDRNLPGMFILLQGAVHLVEEALSESGEPNVFTTLYAGDAVGQRSLLQPGAEREFTAQAASRCVLLQLSVSAFQQLKAAEQETHESLRAALEATRIATSSIIGAADKMDERAAEECKRSATSAFILQAPLLQLLPEKLAATVCSKAELHNFSPGEEVKADGILLVLRGSIQVTTKAPMDRRPSTDANANLLKLKGFFKTEDLWWCGLRCQKKFRLKTSTLGLTSIFKRIGANRDSGTDNTKPPKSWKNMISNALATSTQGNTDVAPPGVIVRTEGADAEGFDFFANTFEHEFNDNGDGTEGNGNDDDDDDDDSNDDDDSDDDGRLVSTVSHHGELPKIESSPQRKGNKFASMRISKFDASKPPGSVHGAQKIRPGFVKHVKAQRRRRSSASQQVLDAENFVDRFRKSTVAAVTSRLSSEWRENARGELCLTRLEFGNVLCEGNLLRASQSHSCGRTVFDQADHADDEDAQLVADKVTGCLALVIPSSLLRETLGARKLEPETRRRTKSGTPMGHFFSLARQHRTDADLSAIAHRLRNMASFSQLPPATRKEICRNAKLEMYSAGELIVRQGDVRADKYYLVLCGSASVLKLPFEQPARRIGDYRASFGSCVLLLQPGDAFGEAAMVRKAGRSASVIAREACCLLAIGYGEYARIFQLNMCWEERKLKHHSELTPDLLEALRRPPALRSSEDVGALVEWSANVEFFQHLNTRARRLLCSELRYERLEAGTLIFREEDEATTAFVVLSGAVSVHQRDSQSVQDKNLLVGSRVNEAQSQLGSCVDVVVVGQMLRRANPHEVGRLRSGIAQEWQRSASGVTRGLTELCILDTAVIHRMVEDNQSVILPDLVKEIVQKPLAQRSVGESQALENLLMRIGFLKQLSHEPAVMQRLSQLVRCKACPAADLLFQQGDEGDMLYIILRGSVQIRKAATPEDSDALPGAASAVRALRRQRTQPKLNLRQCITGLKTGTFRLGSVEDFHVLNFHFGDLAAELSMGDSFGEMALLPNATTRTGTAITVEPCLFLTLLRDDFEETLRLHLKSLVFQPNLAKTKLANRSALNLVDHIRGIRAILDTLEIGKALRALGNGPLNAICERLDYTVLTPGQVIAHKGDTARRMYIIVKGSVQEIASSGEEGEGGTTIFKSGETVLEAALALSVAQHATVRSVGRTVVLSLPGFWYRKLWPPELRLQGKLIMLERSTVFESAYPRELASLTTLMQLRKVPRNAEIDCTGLLVVLRDGACEVHSREQTGIVLAELGPGETFGEGYCCGHEKFLKQLSRERLVSKCQSEVYVLAADQVANVLTASTMSYFTKVASVKHGWHLAYLSRQAKVARRSDHTRAQLLLREAILEQGRQRKTLARIGPDATQQAQGASKELAAAADALEGPQPRYRGNPFRGGDWTQVHYISKAESAAAAEAAARKTTEEVRAPVRASVADAAVPMLSCLGQKMAKSTRSTTLQKMKKNNKSKKL